MSTDWVHINKYSGNGKSTITLYCDINNTSEPRVVILTATTYTYPRKSFSITIRQQAGVNDFTLMDANGYYLKDTNGTYLL